MQRRGKAIDESWKAKLIVQLLIHTAKNMVKRLEANPRNLIVCVHIL